jgi:hypothetical protein
VPQTIIAKPLKVKKKKKKKEVSALLSFEDEDDLDGDAFHVSLTSVNTHAHSHTHTPLPHTPPPDLLVLRIFRAHPVSFHLALPRTALHCTHTRAMQLRKDPEVRSAQYVPNAKISIAVSKKIARSTQGGGTSYSAADLAELKRTYGATVV